MNKHSDKLFILIKSLNKSEKRAFRLTSIQSNENNYHELFSIIDKMEVYDKVSLEHLYKEKAKSDNLLQAKSYLYKQILRTLRSLFEKKSIDCKLYNYLEEAHILELKGLQKQADQILVKAKKIAIQYNKYLFVLEILRLRLSTILAKHVNKIEDDLKECFTDIQSALSLVQEEYAYQELHYSLFLQHRTINKISEAAILELQQNPLFLNPPKHKSTFFSRFLFLNIKALFYHINVDFHSAQKYFKQIIELWEQHKNFIELYPNIYKIQLSNFLQVCHRLGEYDDFPKTLLKIEEITNRTFAEEAETFQNIMSLRLLYYMNNNKYQEASNLISPILEGIEKYRSNINQARELALYYNIYILLFVRHEFEASIEWVAKIIYERRTDSRKDIKRSVQILQFITHIEIKNTEVVESLLNSVPAYLRSKREYGDFEKIIISAFRKLMKVPLSGQTKVYKELYSQLLKIKKEAVIQPTSLEEVILWLESKQKGIPMFKLLEAKK